MQWQGLLNLNFEASNVEKITFHQLPEAKMAAIQYFQYRKKDITPYRERGGFYKKKCHFSP